MSHLLGYNRGFNPNFLQTLLGQNTNAALNTQQYMDMYNYYKNLGTTYADINPYGSLPGLNAGGGSGRMPTSSSASSVPTNPLAALGDLSLFGLSSSNLPHLGTNPAALNLPSSLGNSAALQQMSTSASMYTSPSGINTNLPITSASNMAAGSLASAGNSAAVLSAFEQFKQSFRGSYNSMYNYTGDFGLSSSGSTILDSSKTKNSKQGSTSNKNVNLPGGSKGGTAMGLYSAHPSYMPQPQAQPQSQQHHNLQQQQHNQQQQQQRPSSRNTPNYEPQQHQQQKSKSTTSLSKQSDPNFSARSSSLLSYRRSESSSLAAANAVNQSSDSVTQAKSNSMTQQPKCDTDNGNSASTKTMLTSNAKSIKTPAKGSNLLSSNQKPNQKSTTSQSNSSNNSLNSGSSVNSTKLKTSLSSSTSSTSTPSSSQAESNRSINMGISYPNSKGVDKTSNKPNSPLNMGIVYPKSSSKTSSEMQIIPTSSPPGTISISKQLNELSPSISVTALRNNVSNKPQHNQNIKLNDTNNSLNSTQNAQINKIVQNNSIRRNTSPIPNKSSSTSSLNTSGSASGTSAVANTGNQSNLLARLKMANSKKSTNANNNNSVPPLHRASTMGSIPTTNITSKTSAGLTITSVKNTIKNQNTLTKPGITNQQASTLAKQTAAAAVAKSNVNRLNNTTANSLETTASQKNANTTTSNTTLPSLTAIKRIVKRGSPTVNVSTNKPPALTSSPSLTVTSSNKFPVISSVKSISQHPSSMATISKASITKVNTSLNQLSNSSTMLPKSSSSTYIGSNQQSASNVSRTLAQMQKRLATSQSTPTSSTSTNSSNAVRNTVNIRPVDTKKNAAGKGGVYIIETNINDKKLAIGAPTKSGGGTTVTKVPTQTATKRKYTDPLSKDKIIETKRLKN